MDGFDTSIKTLPKLVVFDLDYTLWPFYVDTHVIPPFKRKGNEIYDSNGRHIKLYKDTISVLEFLKKNNVKTAAASRTEAPVDAHQLCKMFNLDFYFDYKEIYPSCKLKHFKRFQSVSGLDYKDMLFFDDEQRNIVDISPLGVTCVLVKDGMTKDVLNEGLKKWEMKNKP